MKYLIVSLIIDSSNLNENEFGELNNIDAIGYVNHELRNATIDYDSDGLIPKDNSSPMRKRTHKIIVPSIKTLELKIIKETEGYYIKIKSNNKIMFEDYLSHNDIGLKNLV